MSKSSLSNSWNFQVPDQYEDQQIKTISVFDVPGENILLKTLAGRHCFCVIQLKNGLKFKLQAGANQNDMIGVGYQPYEPFKEMKEKFITSVKMTNNMSFKWLGDKLKNRYSKSKYCPFENNCYHVVQNILIWCGFKKQAEVVAKSRRYITENGVANSYEILTGVFLGGALAIGGFRTGNWNPFIKFAQKSNALIGIIRGLGVAVHKTIIK